MDAEKWFGVTLEAVEVAQKRRSEVGGQGPVNIVGRCGAAKCGGVGGVGTWLFLVEGNGGKHYLLWGTIFHTTTG